MRRAACLIFRTSSAKQLQRFSALVFSCTQTSKLYFIYVFNHLIYFLRTFKAGFHGCLSFARKFRKFRSECRKQNFPKKRNVLKDSQKFPTPSAILRYPPSPPPHYLELWAVCFKASLSAKPLLWKWPWFAWKWNCMQNSFSFGRFRTWTRFETEAQENSEMACWFLHLLHPFWIYSQIALSFTLNRIFFLGQWEWHRKTKQPIRFQGFF